MDYIAQFRVMDPRQNGKRRNGERMFHHQYNDNVSTEHE